MIRTRYRDIPLEEAIQCAQPECPRHPGKWEKRRGMPVAIETKALNSETVGHIFRCEGPFYETDERSQDGLIVTVCLHLVEIGD